jgi:hypothetical protein
VDGPHRWPDPLDRLERRCRGDVPRMDEEVRAGDRLDAGRRERPPPTRQMGVGDDR